MNSHLLVTKSIVIGCTVSCTDHVRPSLMIQMQFGHKLKRLKRHEWQPDRRLLHSCLPLLIILGWRGCSDRTNGLFPMQSNTNDTNRTVQLHHPPTFRAFVKSCGQASEGWLSLLLRQIDAQFRRGFVESHEQGRLALCFSLCARILTFETTIPTYPVTSISHIN
jgi:hypothetical protein